MKQTSTPNIFFKSIFLGTVLIVSSLSVSAQVPSVVPKPTAASSNITFPTFAENSLSLNWTKGDGASRIVIARESLPVDSLPKDGTSYTANSVYGQGSTLGSGQFVVYNSNGASTQVTGLTPGKVYHFAIFEFNGSSAFCSYLTTTTVSASRSTLAIEPNLNVTELNFTAVDQTSLSLNFVSGNGDGRIIVAKKGSSVNQEPIDGNGYTANSNFGSGTDLGAGNYVVYSGSEQNVTVAGLSPGSTYHFAAYEYTGSAAESYNYLKTNVARVAQSTRFPEPTTGTSNLSFNTIGESSMVLSWVKGNGSSRIVIARANSAVNQIPVDGQNYVANSSLYSGTDLGAGNYVVYNGSGTGFQLTGLDPSTTYHFAVIEYNGSQTATNYFTGGTVNGSKLTLNPEPSLNGGAIQFGVITSNSIEVILAPGNGEEHMLVARKVEAVNQLPKDGTVYLADTVYANGQDILPGSGNFVLYKGSKNRLKILNLIPNTAYQFAVFEYNGTSISNINYLTNNYIKAKQATLDAEPTKSASKPTFSNITGTSMTVNWTNGDGGSRLLLARSGSISQLPVDGSEYQANSNFGSGSDINSSTFVVYSGTGSSVDVKGLTPNTTYHFVVVEFNGTGTSNNYRTFDVISESKSTLISKPTAAATNLVLSPITDGKAALSWSKGNGTQRILVVREGQPINKFPDDGLGYKVSPVFGTDSTDVGLNHYACYQGTGSSVTVQGLAPEKAYFFALFEFNGNGTESSYLTESFATVNNLPEEPSTSSNNFGFTSIDASTLRINWNSGDGAYRVLLARANSAVNKAPVDGISYTANDTMGRGLDIGLANFVVYNGTGNTVDLKGLKNNTLYHFALFEYNQDIEGPANYSKTPLVGSKSNVVLGIGAKQSLAFSIYPNPSKGQLSIQAKENLSAARVTIYNLNGQIVYQQELKEAAVLDVWTIDTDLPQGMYQMQIVSGKNSGSYPVVIY